MPPSSFLSHRRRILAASSSVWSMLAISPPWKLLHTHSAKSNTSAPRSTPLPFASSRSNFFLALAIFNSSLLGSSYQAVRQFGKSGLLIFSGKERPSSSSMTPIIHGENVEVQAKTNACVVNLRRHMAHLCHRKDRDDWEPAAWPASFPA